MWQILVDKIEMKYDQPKQLKLSLDGDNRCGAGAENMCTVGTYRIVPNMIIIIIIMLRSSEVAEWSGRELKWREVKWRCGIHILG